MPVDKELLKYCANFARVTPRVTPLPKGCMCPPRTALVPRLYGATHACAPLGH